MWQEGKDAVDMSKYNAVIDSGTSVIVGPNHLVEPLIEGIKVHLLCRDIETLPDITFKIGGIEYVMTYKDYVISVTNEGITECVLGIMGASFPPGFNYFILGDSFMRKYYTFFDKNHDRVGFALAK